MSRAKTISLARDFLYWRAYHVLREHLSRVPSLTEIAMYLDWPKDRVRFYARKHPELPHPERHQSGHEEPGTKDACAYIEECMGKARYQPGRLAWTE